MEAPGTLGRQVKDKFRLDFLQDSRDFSALLKVQAV